MWPSWLTARFICTQIRSLHEDTRRAIFILRLVRVFVRTICAKSVYSVTSGIIFNKLHSISTALQFDSPRLHHILHRASLNRLGRVVELFKLFKLCSAFPMAPAAAKTAPTLYRVATIVLALGDDAGGGAGDMCCLSLKCTSAHSHLYLSLDHQRRPLRIVQLGIWHSNREAGQSAWSQRPKRLE